ncbi:MAG: hypothetical protein RL095_3148 [Verrucomicrobiota bacterium]|jgi:hypothetical protein
MKTRTKLILWIGLTLLVHGVFAVIIVGLPWRGAYHQAVADIAARGEPVSAAQLLPPDVPFADNGGPLLESLWRDLGGEAFQKAPKLKTNTYLSHEECRRWMLEEVAEAQRQARLDAELAAMSQADLAARRASLKLKKKPGGSSVPAAKLTYAEEQKLKSGEELKQQMRSLRLLLTTQPGLLERWEEALLKPSFRFRQETGVALFHRQWRPLSLTRQSLYFLNDLSRFYQVKGEPAKAQRCRLLMLRLPRVLDEEISPYASLTRGGITRACLQCLREDLPLLAEEELAEIRSHAAPLQAWPNSRKQLLLHDRVAVIEILQLCNDGRASDFNEQERLLLGTGLRYQQGLITLREIDAAIHGAPIEPSQSSYLSRNLHSRTDTITKKWKLEAALIRQFRLGLEIESIHRRTGRYPVDLEAIPLPKEDAEGHRMKYQVFADGAGACLEFPDPLGSQSLHFPLGQAPKEHSK